MEAIIDTDTTNWGITDDCVTVYDNEIFVNVLSLNTSTFSRINLTVEEELVAPLPFVPLLAGLPLMLSGLLGIDLLARIKKAA